MVLLPDGFALPPLPYLLAMLAALGAVASGFRRSSPAITGPHVVALAAWMVLGACVHVLHQIGSLPPAVEPFGGTPAVYLTVAALAGAVWLGADRTVDPGRVPIALGAVGGLALVPVVAAALAVGADRGGLELFWPLVALVASVPVTAAAWFALGRISPRAVAVTGSVGALAVFGHVLDAVSTTVGIDFLGFGERTPLARVLMDFAASLPVGAGGGWLFILVKLVVACGVVVLLTEYVEDVPSEGYLLLGFVAAVGLGPGAHNLLLFAVAG
ncbi:DUF63 family protein [Haloferacaceae archaeon DSL9]